MTPQRKRGRRGIWILLAAVVALIVYSGVTLVVLVNRPSAEGNASATAVIYAAGDIAGERDGAQRVAAMLSHHNFDALLTLGDHVYESGSPAEFNGLYAPTFGVFDDRVRPAPGNHDYETADAGGYFGYFGDNAPSFPGTPYYAFSLGGWAIYSLNSEIGETQPGSEMYEWLRNELSERASDCILAYWHKPVFTVGRKDNDEGDMKLIWSMLAAHGADIVLAGHDHNYQRWEAIDGITSFVVGTGGRSRYPIEREDDRVAFTDDGNYGALELTLRAGGARFAFRAADDQVLDAGDLSCSTQVGVGERPAAPVALRAEPGGDGDGGVERLTWDVPADRNGIIGYVVLRGHEVIGFTSETAFEDTTLPGGASVLYSVRSVNAAGLRSASSPAAHSGGQVVGFSGTTWSALDRNPASPTRDKPQSKLWFADDAWWGILFTDGLSDRVDPGYYIHRFDPAGQAWANTKVMVDERDRSHADALWDDEDQRLYVVSTIDSGAIKLYRYKYQDDVYQLDDGFPARLTETGSESATIARDSDGRLWVSLTQRPDGSGSCRQEELCVVSVMHSTTADYRWTAPLKVPVDASEVGPDDVSAVVAYGGDRIGIAWSNQIDGSFRFATHRDGDPDGAWMPETLAVAPRLSDDHINVKADDEGRVFLVLKTSLNDPGNAPADAPLVAVWVRDAGGTWRYGTAWTVGDDVTRPQVMVDPTLETLAVVVAAPGSGGVIYAKTAPIATLAFESGPGTPLMFGAELNNPTTTKQLVDLVSGALVLAGDTATHTYWYNTVTVAR